MCYKLQQILILLLSLGILYRNIFYFVGALNCKDVSGHANKLQFSLVRYCQRSHRNIIALENTQSLRECVTIAKRLKGLAINFAPLSRRNTGNIFANSSNDPNSVFYFNSVRQLSRRHFWQQPEEFFNCHIMACPENQTYQTMINDSRFDYFSLYARAPALQNYSCIPQVGLFQIQTIAVNYRDAVEICASNFSGALAHITSPNRTNSLAQLLVEYNENRRLMRYGRVAFPDPTINLAYVGLHFNRSWVQFPTDFLTPTNESLKCFYYRAWAPGHPRRGGTLANSSCVAISTSKTWVTIDCDRRLPFICELYTSNLGNDYVTGSEESQSEEDNLECLIN